MWGINDGFEMKRKKGSAVSKVVVVYNRRLKL